MDDLIRRVGRLEEHSAAIQADVAAMKAQIPHLGTKADISAIAAQISSTETSMIKWSVGTLIAVAGVVFAAAKLIH